MPKADTNVVMRMEFETSADKIIHERHMYTVLDVLGNVGGLLDMLTYLGQIVLAIIFKVSGSETVRYLTQALFYTNRGSRPDPLTDTDEHLPSKAMEQIRH